MFCDKCGYTMDSFDKECLRCHGKGLDAAQTTLPQSAKAGAVAFNFTDGLTFDEERQRARAKVRKTLNRVVTFVGVFLITQYGFSLYQRRAFETALLTHYNEELRATGSGTSCTSAELYGFGIFATKSASGYIHCSDGMQRRASWTRDNTGKAEWTVEETGQTE